MVSTAATPSLSSLALSAKLFRGLADPSRLSLIETLRHGEKTVSELVEATGLTQPNVSNHLACLRDCGIVTGEQRGRYVLYRLADARIGAMLELAEDFLRDSGAELDACRRYRNEEAQ